YMVKQWMPRNQPYPSTPYSGEFHFTTLCTPGGIGLLFGLERGWRARGDRPGGRARQMSLCVDVPPRSIGGATLAGYAIETAVDASSAGTLSHTRGQNAILLRTLVRLQIPYREFLVRFVRRVGRPSASFALSSSEPKARWLLRGPTGRDPRPLECRCKRLTRRPKLRDSRPSKNRRAGHLNPPGSRRSLSA